MYFVADLLEICLGLSRGVPFFWLKKFRIRKINLNYNNRMFRLCLKEQRKLPLIISRLIIAGIRFTYLTYTCIESLFASIESR